MTSAACDTREDRSLGLRAITLTLPPEVVPLFIGAGGSNIKLYQEWPGISTVEVKEQEVTISGMVEAVRIVSEQVQLYLEQHHVGRLVVPPRLLPLLIGKKGVTLDKFRKMRGIKKIDMQHGHVVVLIGGREAVATAKKKLKAVLRSRSTYTERYIFLPVTVRSCVPNLLVFAAKISSEDEDFAVFKTVGKSMQTLYVSGEASGVKRMTVWVFTTLRQMVALDEVKCVEFAANRFLADAVATMVGDMPGIRSAEFHEGIYGQESFISIKAPCLVADSLVLWAYWCAAAMLSDEP